MRSFGGNGALRPDVAWCFSLSRSQYLRDLDDGGTHYASSAARAPGIAMIMIVAAVVVLSLCAVRPRGFVAPHLWRPSAPSAIAVSRSWPTKRRYSSSALAIVSRSLSRTDLLL